MIRSMRCFVGSSLLIVVATAFSRNHIHAFHRTRVASRLSPTMISVEGGKLQSVTFHTADVTNSVKFFETCFGMELIRNDKDNNAFVGYSTEEDENFQIQFVGHTGEFHTGSGISGVSLFVPDVQTVVDAVSSQFGTEFVELGNYTYGPSLIPDEDKDLQNVVTRAVVADPSSGYTVEVFQTEDAGEGEGGAKQPMASIQKVNLRVSDLESAVEFYTGPMGMTLHRKRSLVPQEPAMTAFLSYGDEEKGSTVLEIKYAYGKKKIDLGQYGSQVTISSTDLDEAGDTKKLVRIGDVEAVTICDPDGVVMQVADELELLKLSLL